MAAVSYHTCEPFRAWNRLEPRARKEDFDKNLQAGVHDALWFLTRQWQFGEFQGEDTGSAIFAKLHLKTTKLSHYKPFNGSAVVPYSDQTPLEETVEQTFAPFNDKAKIQSGKYFRKILAQYASGLIDFDANVYKQKLRSIYPYQSIDPITPADDSETIIEKSKKLSNQALTQFNDFFLEEDFDGYRLYLAAKSNLLNTRNQLKELESHNTLIDNSLSEYITLFEELYSEELQQAVGAWHASQLEYQFKCLLPEENNTKTILAAEEYYSGNLDWYSLDIDKRSSSVSEFASVIPDKNLLEDHLLTVIPTEARFAGMPNSRWWQFENGAVDLNNFKADTTDLANLIFSEYAFMYSNDWMIIPIPVPVGTLTEVKGILIKDVFGEYELVESALQGSSDNWTGWGMYNLSVRKDVSNKSEATDTRLFMPPSVVKNNESQPIEQVHFLRDEMANMVWGIETTLDSGLGKGMDGHAAANAFQNYLERVAPTPPVVLPEGAALSYSLGNSVPENWIPFIPVHLDNLENRAIQFQRAAMPRTFNNLNTPIRPNSTLLRLGIGGPKVKPFYIHEEEIPRAGAKVISTYQRTRWYNGKVVNWFGNRKTMGRGEGSSGLQFDSIHRASKA